ncbi:MAG TPA: sulfotransferase domain-containing protein [Polyangiales bacterium]
MMPEKLARLRDRAMRRLERRWLKSEVSSVEETHPDDVFLAGFPKSGNTWLQHLTAALHAGCDLERTTDSVVQLVVPDMHAKRYYERWSTPMVFKTHHLPQPRFRRVIFLIRDGRDALVSYYHYNRAVASPAVSLRDMVVEGKSLFPCRWHEHAAAWSANPYRAEMITVRYEALKTDAFVELRRIADFLHKEVSDDVLRAIAASATFERMRAREDRQGWADKHWPKDSKFVRRGMVGSFADEMPSDLVKVFEADAGPMLVKYGYRLSASER